MKNNKKFGFTIAEVLITLGVTGVLILLLVSSFRTNSMTAWHKSNDYKTGIVKYDKVYNAINLSFTNQALKNAGFFKENKETVLNTALNSLNSTCSGASCNFSGVDGTTDTYKRQLADGSQLSVKAFAGNNGTEGGLSDLSYVIYIDTNGDATPNKIGQDRLSIYVDKDGNIFNVNPKTGKSYVVEAQKKYNGESYRIPCGQGFTEDSYILATKDLKTGLYSYDKSHCRAERNTETCEPHGEFYEIYDISDFDFVRNHLDCNYRLMTDINLAGVDWKPLGDMSGYFQGEFDGNNHVIKNLTIHKTVPSAKIQDFSAFFALLYKAEVKNLNLDNIDINVEYTDSQVTPLCAGVVAWAYESTLSNIKVNGKIVCNSAQTYTGDKFWHVGYAAGIMANGSANVNNCHSKVSITSNVNSGGLISNIDTTTGKILNSSYEGEIISSGSSVGGLIGTAPSCKLVENCNSVANITGGISVGGLVGSSQLCPISKSYAIGNITGLFDSTTSLNKRIGIGGLVGSLYTATLKESYFKGNVSSTASNNAGAIAGYNASNNIVNCYAITDKVSSLGMAGGVIGGSESNVVSYHVKNSYVVVKNIEGTNHSGAIIGDHITSNNGSPSCDNSWITNTFYNKTLLSQELVDYRVLTYNRKWGNCSGYAGKTEEEMKTASTYSSWDKDIWDIRDGAYPKLKNVGGPQ